jgi:hypothetical protein
VIEVPRPGKVPTFKAATESATHVTASESATHVAATEPATHMAATEPATHMAATEPATHMAATEPATHMAATEPATHMAATTEAAAHVAAPATVSSPTTATSPAARKSVSSQSPSESGKHSQSDRGLTQHCTYSFGRDRVHLAENTVTTVRFDCATPIDDDAARRSATFSNRYARYCRSGKPAWHATRVLSQILTDKSALTFSSDARHSHLLVREALK